MQWKAAVLKAIWQVLRTPPGSETRACAQRGNSGTWEVQLSPCERRPEEKGYREIKSPGAVGLQPAGSETRDVSERHKLSVARKVSGKDSEERTNLRRAYGSLSGT